MDKAQFLKTMNEPTYNQDVSPFNESLLFFDDHTPYVPRGNQVWASSFRQYAPYESLTRMIFDPDFQDEEGYDYASDPQLENYQGSAWRFLNSGSRAETAQRIKNLNVDLEDQNILANTDQWLPQVVATLATPAILAPLAPLRVLRSSRLGKRFTGGALFTAAVIAPEELMMASEIENRTLGQSAVVLTGAGLIGGSLSAVLGKYSNRIYFNDGKGGVLWSESVDPTAKVTTKTKSKPFNPVKDVKTNSWKPVGANVSPERQRQSMWQSMEGDALKETGVGLEKLPWNPVIRLTQSPNPIVRGLASQMVDFGGMIQKKVAGEEAMSQSVEATFRTTYTPSLVNVMRMMDEQYLSYRGFMAKEGDISRSLQMLRLKGKDFLNKPTGLTEYQFRERVSNALRNNGDQVTDGATSYVNSAASKAREHLDVIKNQATEVKLFERALQKQIKKLEDQISKSSGSTKTALEAQLAKAKANLARIQANGVNVNTADGFLPRIWRVDKIMDNSEAFLEIVKNWSRTQYGLSNAKATKFANEMIDQVTRSKPYYNLDEGIDSIDWITQASSTKARTFEIPDRLVVDFLENDVEAILRHHTTTMGMDIELTRAFGDVSMSNVIKQVTDEYNTIIKQAPTTAERQKLAKQLEDDLRDIRGLRDRLRGTYGASKDPHALSSRAVRTMKSFNVLVGMGSAVVSSVPDVMRTIMVEGLKATNEKGLRHFFKNSRTVIKQLSKKELNKAGISADAYLGLRSAQFTDIGDMFGSRFAWERNMNQSVGIFFMLNGLNYWNQFMKEFAGNVSMLRMTENIMQDWSTISSRDKEKFLANGIDQQMHSRMQLQMRNHAKQEDGEWLPETDLWTDATARLKFRNALNQTVERTIITPGAGDRALWTSTWIINDTV